MTMTMGGRLTSPHDHDQWGRLTSPHDHDQWVQGDPHDHGHGGRLTSPHDHDQRGRLTSPHDHDQWGEVNLPPMTMTCGGG